MRTGAARCLLSKEFIGMLNEKIENPAALFQAERGRTVKLTSMLGAEDMVLQSMADASPAKWHLAHTTWFFEEFLLARRADYRRYDPSFSYLFNSYYESVGERQPRPHRGMLSRPTLAAVLEYRDLIDLRVREHIRNASPADIAIVTLGIHHEMQHQELLLTDILHAFSMNPLLPAVFAPALPQAERQAERHENRNRAAAPLQFHAFSGGLCGIGAEAEGFAFDCERPRHTVFLHPFALANRAVTNGEWIDFIEDGGYRNPAFWLSDGWARSRQEGWEAPLYWRREEGEWRQFGLDGLHPLEMNAPVCHISYYEADAYARRAGCRLPTEQEWEYAATGYAIEGNFLNGEGGCRPRPAAPSSGLRQLYGDVWEWTQSAFAAYPGFTPGAGALGEYNGKFMSGQFVLRGGSCATNKAQLRPGYRNFFYPHQRWQFSGLRLARDA
jgi:ergothioneine biosynthesis protein EgtB